MKYYCSLICPVLVMLIRTPPSLLSRVLNFSTNSHSIFLRVYSWSSIAVCAVIYYHIIEGRVWLKNFRKAVNIVSVHGFQ